MFTLNRSTNAKHCIEISDLLQLINFTPIQFQIAHGQQSICHQALPPNQDCSVNASTSCTQVWTAVLILRGCLSCKLEPFYQLTLTMPQPHINWWNTLQAPSLSRTDFDDSDKIPTSWQYLLWQLQSRLKHHRFSQRAYGLCMIWVSRRLPIAVC